MSTRAAAILAFLLLGACRAPRPQEVLVDLKTPVGTAYGVSTEAGILVLSEALMDQEECPFRYHVGNGMFDDVATVQKRGDPVSILRPVSSRPNEARIGRLPARPGEALYVELRNSSDEPILLPVRLHDEGKSGDLVLPDVDGEIDELAHRFAGCALFAWRDRYMQLVGIMNGVYSRDPRVLAFVGLDELSQTLPQTVSYLEREAQPRRADFEWGVPRDIAGEQVYASGVGPVPAYDSGEEVVPPEASETTGEEKKDEEEGEQEDGDGGSP